MPILKRSEIIEQYGFDPLESNPEGGVSVVPKARDAAPITVGDVEKKPPLQETQSASVIDNLQAGAVKGVISDPLMIFGLAAGVTDYALGKLGVTEGGTFEEQLYVDGGAQEVKDHLQSYADGVKAQHPDWQREQVLAEVDRYRLTEDFFNYTTDRMKPGLSQGMKNAYWANKGTGVNKLPNQETTTDVITQALGSVAIPTGIISSLASRALARGATRTAVKVADAVLSPGTDIGNYGVRSVGTGVAVNAAIDQGMRMAQGDPNLYNENALWDFSKTHMELPREADITPAPGSTHVPQLPPTANPVQDAWDTSDKAVAAGAGAAAIAGAFGARALVRRFQPHVEVDPRVNPNVTFGPPSRSLENQIEDRQAQQGFEVPADRPSHELIGDNIDAAVNRDAPIEQTARAVGGQDLEADVMASVGTLMTPHARAAHVTNYFDTGLLPDGTQATSPRLFNETISQMDPADVQAWTRSTIAKNELDNRDDVLAYSQDRYLAAVQARRDAQANNATPQHIGQLQAREANEAARIQAHMRDERDARVQYQDVSSADLRAAVAAGDANPNVRRLNQLHEQINRELVDIDYRSGLLTSAERAARLQRPHHTSMFAVQQGSRGWLPRNILDKTLPDENISRNTQYEFGTDRVNIADTLDPTSSLNARASAAVDRASYNLGLGRVLNDLVANDPGGRYIQYRGPQADVPADRRVSVFMGGIEHHYEVARKEFADALKQAPLDMGTTLSTLNAARKLVQLGYTGWLSPNAPLTAIRSLGFDIFSGIIARPTGRSFGLVGYTLRRLAGSHGPTLERLIQVLEQVDAYSASSTVQVFATLAQMPIWKMWGSLGQQWMRAAVVQNPNSVLGLIARTPGGATFLDNMGSAMWRAYERTPIGMLRHHGAFTYNAQLTDSWGARNRLDTIVEQTFQGGRYQSSLTNAARLLKNAWVGALSNIHDAAKVSYFAQNLAILEARHGMGNVTEAQMRRLANEARTMSGDMQAIPGNTVIQSASASLPYFNMMIQAQRYIIKSLWGTSTEQSINTMARMAGVAGAAWMGLQMIEEMGLNDWFYEKLNDWDRVGHIFVPTPDNLIHKARTGSYYQPDLAKGEDPTKFFYRVKITPEIAQYTQVFLAGLEAAGLISRGRNLSESTAKEDLRRTITGAIGTASVPGLNIITAMTGSGTLDFMRTAEGRGILQEPPATKGMGILKDQTPGGIPVLASELAKAILGTTGSMMMSALDAEGQSLQAGASHINAMWRGVDSIKQSVQLPSVPGLWKAEEKVYTTSPIGNRIYDTQQKVEALEAQWRNEFSASARLAGRVQINDPAVRRLLASAHNFFERGGYPKIEKTINASRKKIDELALNRGTMSEAEAVASKRVLLKKMQAQQERLAGMAERFDMRMKERYGAVFQAYEETPDLQGLVNVTRKAAQQGRGVQQ